jgi:hypothetical protein
MELVKLEILAALLALPLIQFIFYLENQNGSLLLPLSFF